MQESCYWLLSQNWSFCFVSAGGYSNIKIFGYAEFLASLAILAVIFTLVDIRYKFRVAVAPLPIIPIAFIVIAFVGFGTLISDIWVAEGWWVIKENPITQALWQGILGALFLLTFIVWIWYAFIFPPKFGRLNAQRYLKFVYRVILKGNPSELNVIADELSRSAKNIIDHSYSISERSQLTSNKVNSKVTERNRPKLDGKTKESVRRPAFELHELRALLKLLSPYIESGRTKDVRERREILRDYVEMLVDTGARPGIELLDMKWKQIRFMMNPISTVTDQLDEDGEVIEVHSLNRSCEMTVKGKTGQRQIIGRLPSIRVLERIAMRNYGVASSIKDPLTVNSLYPAC